VDPIFLVGRTPPHLPRCAYPSVLPARDRSKREAVVQSFQVSDRGGDGTDIHCRSAQILHTAEVDDQTAFAATASIGNCGRQRPTERLNIAQTDLSRRGQHESSVDGPRRIESQR
jgi:hypothetical protein